MADEVAPDHALPIRPALNVGEDRQYRVDLVLPDEVLQLLQVRDSRAWLPRSPTRARSEAGDGRAGLEGEEIPAPMSQRGQVFADSLRVAEVDVRHDDAPSR